MSEKKWNLSRLSSGERSALRSCAGVMMGSNMQATEAFYRALDVKCKPYEEKAWFAAMCMQCLWHTEECPSEKPFEQMVREIYQNPIATDSSRRRCTAYMDQPWCDDGFLLGKICALVRMMRSASGSIMPDFNVLADDLTNWNYNDRYVQRRWIKTICMKNEEELSNVD